MQEDKGTSKFIWVIAAVLLVLAVGGLVYAATRSSVKDTETATDMPATSQEQTEQPAEEPQPGATVIVFTDNGFEPMKYLAKVGEAVTVRNDSSMDLEFSSDDHPTHLEHPKINLGVLAPGESARFTPDGAGTYEFHDHINSQFTGSLTVE